MYSDANNSGLSGLGKKLHLSKKWRRNLQSLSLSKQLKWAANRAKAKGKEQALIARATSTKQAAAAAAATQADVDKIRMNLPGASNLAPPGVNAPANLPPIATDAGDGSSLPLILAGFGVLGILFFLGRRK